MELLAVIEVLTAVPSTQPLHLALDSRYVIDALTKWADGWERRGWRRPDGSPVKNVDLIRQAREALAGRDVTWEWVRGHDGVPGNEAADVRARNAAAHGAEVRHGPGWSTAS